DRMRPRTLDEFVGQEHLIGPGKPLRAQIERDDLGSLIFWGPPGTGKTTLAQIIARMTRAEFIEFSAVLAGRKESKQVMAESERGLGAMKLSASNEVLKQIAAYSSGDARSAYNVLEVAAALATSGRDSHSTNTAKSGTAATEKISENEITTGIVQDALQKRILLYDKTGEEHYNLISA